VTVDETILARLERERSIENGSVMKLEIDVPQALEDVERQVIEATLRYTGGDKTRAARHLRIGRKTIYRKLQQQPTNDAQ
ncbi:MAG: helix-turn-helix domain-containing protein, partial [Pyrinomonadaceae bacterium]|nr:helix-turn-helix domain-containing protein [Pyrinomonadaceae bacterium]